MWDERGRRAARAADDWPQRLWPLIPASSLLSSTGMSALWEPVGADEKWAAHSRDPAHLEKISARWQDLGPKNAAHVESRFAFSYSRRKKAKCWIWTREYQERLNPQPHLPALHRVLFLFVYLTLRLRVGECETQYLCFYFLRPYLWCVSLKTFPSKLS